MPTTTTTHNGIRQKSGAYWLILSLITSVCVLPVFTYPSLHDIARIQQQNDDNFPAAIAGSEGRKFAEKPNATKKVLPTIEDRNDLEDVQTNQLQVSF